MAKAPLAGAVKTRLVPPLTPAQAAEFYRALLLDQFDHLRNYAGAERYVFFAPADAENILRDLGGAEYAYLAQSGGDLGARMQQIFADALAIWAIATSCSLAAICRALPWAILDEAFRPIGRRRNRGWSWGRAGTAVIILVGMNRPTPEIFADMTWSHERVLAETTARLDGA